MEWALTTEDSSLPQSADVQDCNSVASVWVPGNINIGQNKDDDGMVMESRHACVLYLARGLTIPAHCLAKIPKKNTTPSLTSRLHITQEGIVFIKFTSHNTEELQI